MIVTNKVNIYIVGRTLKYYRELGYKCNVKEYHDILVSDLPQTSHVLIDCKCDYCGKLDTIPYYVYTKSIKTNGKKSCDKCKQIKVEETNLKKYGVKRPLQNKQIQEKTEETNLKKYGVKNYNLLTTSKEHLSQLNKEKYIKKIKNLNIGEFIKINELGTYDIKCNKCQKIFMLNSILMTNRIALKKSPCYHCLPLKQTNAELEIVNYIKSLINTEIIINTRKIIKPYELDIYLPEYKLAIEFNGLYWHSDIYKNKNYHINKTELCEKNGIRLIHIWSDQWENKQNIVKNIIKNIVVKNNKRIYARKCEIVKLNNTETKLFLDKYHIQGHRPAKYYYGLKYNDNIVSVATFNVKISKFINSKKEEKNIPELIRFCSGDNIVTGGLTKLIKNFLKNTKNTKIISYADRCIFNANGYINAGFNIISKSKPGYYYTFNNHTERKHRYNFRKDKLIKMGHDKKLTEQQIMANMGHNRIYDCGQIKLLYSI